MYLGATLGYLLALIWMISTLIVGTLEEHASVCVDQIESSFPAYFADAISDSSSFAHYYIIKPVLIRNSISKWPV